MKQYIVPFLLIPVVTHAECVLQDRTVTQHQVRIEERDQIRRDVIPYFNHQKKCIVSFRARVGKEWHSAHGEHAWSGDQPATLACAQAMSQAEHAVIDRIGQAKTVSERALICRDDTKPVLTQTQSGTLGRLSQFRPHPEYTGGFYHNGTQCRWFVETNFVSQNVRTFQGIICQVQADQWVVVDKF